jgi:hypothetical protein
MLSSLAFAAAIFGTASAGPFNFADTKTFQLYPRAACEGNTASTRSEWCDYSIETDYYETIPDTGVTREYWVSTHLLPTTRPLSLNFDTDFPI